MTTDIDPPIQLTSCPRFARSILDLIGNTPVLELNRIKQKLGLEGRLLSKLENLNPGGSKKDRVALSMVRQALLDGKLASGQPLVEVTSGNTGTGLAIVCQALGHPFYAVMSSGNTRSAQMMRALGANVVLVDQAPGSTPGQVNGQDMRLVKRATTRLIAELGASMWINLKTRPITRHTKGLPPKNCGNSAKVNWMPSLRLSVPGVRLVAWRRAAQEESGTARVCRRAGSRSALASGCCSDAGHSIQGGGYGREKLSQMEGVHVDGHMTCTDSEAAANARLLALQEGVLAGYSTVAQLHAAIKLLRGPERGNCVAFLVCDTGMKLLFHRIIPVGASFCPQIEFYCKDPSDASPDMAF